MYERERERERRERGVRLLNLLPALLPQVWKGPLETRGREETLASQGRTAPPASGEREETLERPATTE